MFILAAVFSFSLFNFGQSMIEEIPLPQDYEQCLDNQYQKTDLTRSVGYHVYWKCKQQSAYSRSMENGYNITYDEYNYMITLLPPREIFSSAGFKTFRAPNAKPRIRKEYRRFTENERKSYHRAINLLKKIPVTYFSD